MKNYIFLALIALFLTGCMMAQGKEDYIPVGPQNLSVQIKNGKDLPIFTNVTQITRPWANIGVQRMKYLPNDPKVINATILRFQNFAAAHGADALLIKEYYDEDANNRRPITLATNIVKYLDNLTEEDDAKITEFAKTAAMGRE